MEIKRNEEIREKVKFIKKDYIKHQKRMKTIVIALSIIVCTAAFFLITIYKEAQPVLDQNLKRDQKKIHFKKKTEKSITEIVSKVKRSIVLVNTFDDEGNPISQGSGFFIEKCKIITNRHVLKNAYTVKIKSHAGEYQAIEISADNKKCDLVILSVPDEAGELNFPPLNLSFPEVGQKVIVIGNPFGLEATVSDGIVSANREIKHLGKIIQITSPISPGSSGSPVFNLFGEVIGVATFQIYEGQNLNFAIPISKINELSAPEVNDIASLNLSARIVSKSVDAPLRVGIDFFEKRDYENALTYFDLALDEDPMNAEIHYYMGMCYKENNVGMAVTEFINAIKLDPTYIDAYYMLGVAYMALKEYQTASNYFEKALELNPENQEVLFQLRLINTILEKNNSAFEFLQEISDVESNILIKYYIGINYVKIEKYDQAELIFNEVISKDPDFIPAYLGLGYVSLGLGNWSAGIDQLSNILSSAPANEEIHYILGLLHLGNNDFRSALNELEELYKINKSSEFCRRLSEAMREQYRGGGRMLRYPYR
ncbi:MAG: tetratricopeptide repeat protein [Candidatus Aminicenantes bacterium]|nr:tetratricopeptide repeat protein [Candidatus Aminicenantes bacterium]